MVLGLKTGRVHHYLSDLEYAHHLLAEYDTAVTDIREQYALLPWEETQEIASAIGVRHPTYPGTKTPIVMTSDLVLTVKRPCIREEVICVKPSTMIDPSNAKAQRTLEKLLIEQTYWARRGSNWHISTDKHLPATRVRNLDMLRSALVSKELDSLAPYLKAFVQCFAECWKRTSTLNEVLQKISDRLRLTPTQSFALFGRSVWFRLLAIDLDTEPILHHFPVRWLEAAQLKPEAHHA